MSQYYDVQVEIASCGAADAKRVRGVLARWGFDGEHADTWKGATTFDGNITLAGGTTPAQAHQQLRELLSAHRVVTRWRCLEFQEWDEVFESPPPRRGVTSRKRR